jgi:DNA replication protein DnaC
LSGCPDGRCDGSGFLYDEATRRARDCSCRPRRLSRKRAAALEGRIPKIYRGLGFDREPLIQIEREYSEVVSEVKRYLGSLEENLTTGRGLWFEGDVGTGKTTLAMMVSKTAIEQGFSVAIYSLPRLLRVLRDTFNEVSRFSLVEFADRLTGVDLLHIDDVGAQQTTDWSLEQLYSMVDERYAAGRPVMITTNLSRPKLEEQLGHRTVSRLVEMCRLPLPMYGRDRRGEQNLEEHILATPHGEYGTPRVDPSAIRERGWH